MGDSNVCASKWNESNFKHKNVAEEIKGSLAQCGMFNFPLGHTYQADRLSKNGETIESSLDHVYLSSNLEELTNTFKLNNSSTDHVPKIVQLKQKKNLLENELGTFALM